MDISNKIRELQKAKNLTQKQISDKIGLTLTGFQNCLKNNEYKVSLLCRIADAFEVPVTTFFDVENEKSTKGCEEVLKENENLKDKKRFLESERVHLIKELASSMFIRFVLNNFSFVPEGLKNEKRFDYLVNEISNKQNYIIHLNENLRMPKELKEEVIEQALYEYNQRNKDTIESYIAVYIGMRNGIKNEAKNDTK